MKTFKQVDEAFSSLSDSAELAPFKRLLQVTWEAYMSVRDKQAGKRKPTDAPRTKLDKDFRIMTDSAKELSHLLVQMSRPEMALDFAMFCYRLADKKANNNSYAGTVTYYNRMRLNAAENLGEIATLASRRNVGGEFTAKVIVAIGEAARAQHSLDNVTVNRYVESWKRCANDLQRRKQAQALNGAVEEVSPIILMNNKMDAMRGEMVRCTQDPSYIIA